MSIRLVLASNSPRRRTLLALLGWEFRVIPADVDESPCVGETPVAYVLRLAEAKVRYAANKAYPEEWVVAADTTVADQVQILGKPTHSAEAEAMLRQLRGHTHQVYTALAVTPPGREVVGYDLCATDVPMRIYSDDEIQSYVASGDPLDKAGAYAIQHPEFKPVIDLQGCYASVMGLPVCHLTRLLRSLGLNPAADVPQACQSFLQYTCPVYQQVLAVTRRSVSEMPESTRIPFSGNGC